MTLAASLVIVISCSSSSADSGGAFSRRTSYQKSIPRSRRTLIRLIDENHRQSFVRAVYLIYLYYTPSHGVGWYFDAVCVRIPIGSSSPKMTKRFYQNLFLENLVRGKRYGSPIAYGRTGQSPAIGITGSGCRNVVSGE
jgi:hypothetical protein